MFRKIKNSESGNIFTILVGAVALVGVVSVASINMLSGPVATSAKVMNKTMADSQMFVNNKIIILNATNQGNAGDCDGDSYIEPEQWENASGAGPDGVTGSQGGGFLPSNLGVATTDPWGTKYGYCVWDVSTVDNAGCGGAAQRRLAGSPTPTAGDADTQYVQALISAGPDRIFQTKCIDYVNATTAILTAGGDDIVQTYTYSEASAVGGGLWNIQTGNVEVAEIDKAIKFADQTEATVCNAASVNAMRYNDITNTIQKCDGAAGTWSDISGGSGGGAFSLNTIVNPNVVYNNGDPTLDDFVFGSPQLADDANAAHDNRMFFNKDRAAFRAGKATGTHWDDLNVGDQSIAMGSDIIASGDYSFVAGEQSVAGGNYSVAMGQDVVILGNNSFAFGLGTASGIPRPRVSGANSFGIFMGDHTGVNITQANIMAILGGDFVVGSPQLADDGNTAHDNRMYFDKDRAAFRAGNPTGTQWDVANVGNSSAAFGNDTIASGDFSFAAGEDTNASGTHSIAMGYWNEASGDYSFAVGRQNIAGGNYSVAMGQDVKALGNNSFAFGIGTASGTRPKVSGANSFGIFMGDHTGADITQANTMAILGGEVVIGSDTGDGLASDSILKIIGDNKDVHHYSYSSTAVWSKADYSIYRARGTEAAPAAVQNGDKLGALRFWGYDGANFQRVARVGATVNGTVSAGSVPTDLTFSTGTSSPMERMRITSDGEVLVGTDISNGTYSIMKLVGNARDISHYSYSSLGSGYKADYDFFRARGTEASPAAVNNGDELGAVRFGAYDGGSFRRTVKIGTVINGAVSSGNVPTDLTFSTGTGTGFPVERMRLSSSGNLGIARTSPAYPLDVYGGTSGSSSITVARFASSPPAGGGWELNRVIIDNMTAGTSKNALSFYGSGAIKWEVGNDFQANNNQNFFIWDGVARSVRFYIDQNGAVGLGTYSPTAGYRLDVRGNVRIQGSGTTCYIGNGTGNTSCSSDIRLKKDIKKINNALDKISRINGVSFKWKDEAKDQTTKIGLIAQNIEKTFPEVVMNDPDGIKAVDYSALVAPLVEAVKELKTKNEKLENELALVKSDIEKLKSYTGYKHDKAAIASNFTSLILGILLAMLALVFWRKSKACQK